MNRGEIWNIFLDPTKGSEQEGVRPALIISPDSMNYSLDTKVVIPLTTKLKNWPSRISTRFNNKHSQLMCEQIRTVSAKRMIKYIGKIPDEDLVQTLYTLRELYGTI